MNYDIKEIVKNKNPCTFQNFRKGHLWYKTDCGFEFPVPVNAEEIGDAIFNSEEKPMLMMRYIKKHIKALEEEKAKIQQEVV